MLQVTHLSNWQEIQQIRNTISEKDEIDSHIMLLLWHWVTAFPWAPSLSARFASNFRFWQTFYILRFHNDERVLRVHIGIVGIIISESEERKCLLFRIKHPETQGELTHFRASSHYHDEFFLFLSFVLSFHRQQRPLAEIRSPSCRYLSPRWALYRPWCSLRKRSRWSDANFRCKCKTHETLTPLPSIFGKCGLPLALPTNDVQNSVENCHSVFNTKGLTGKQNPKCLWRMAATSYCRLSALTISMRFSSHSTPKQSKQLIMCFGDLTTSFWNQFLSEFIRKLLGVDWFCSKGSRMTGKSVFTAEF